MLSPTSKERILENFYSIDYIFFGKPVREMKTCCEALMEEYLTIKGSLLSVLSEMYKVTKHSPKPIGQKLTEKRLHILAAESAKIARQNSKAILVTEKSEKDIKKAVKSLIQESKKVKINEAVEKTIRKKGFSLAIDNLLISRMLNESKSPKSLNEMDGRIIEEAYKVLRESLVDSAILIAESNESKNK